MSIFKFNNKKLYIDGILKRQFDAKIKPSLAKKDEDAVFIVDGRERFGKSVFAMIIAAYISLILKRKFDTSNICMSPKEFRQRIQNAKKNEVIIDDEAHRGMGSAGALSEINRILKDLMMEMGQKNLCVIVILPTFFLLERYVALFRAKGLFHIYKQRGKKGFWCYFNEKNKLKLYMKGKKELNYNCIRWPRFRGRFYNQYSVNEEEYRKKKAVSFKTRPRETRAEVYKEQRDRFIKILHDVSGFSVYEIAHYCKMDNIKLKKSAIAEIIAQFQRKPSK